MQNAGQNKSSFCIVACKAIVVVPGGLLSSLYHSIFFSFHYYPLSFFGFSSLCTVIRVPFVESLYLTWWVIRSCQNVAWRNDYIYLFFLNSFSDSFKNRRCEFSSNGVQSFTWRVCCGAGRWQRGIFISWHSQLWMLCKYDLQWQYMIGDSWFPLCISQFKSLYSFMWMLHILSTNALSMQSYRYAKFLHLSQAGSICQ